MVLMSTDVSVLPVAGSCLNNGRVDAWERLARYIVARRVALGYKRRPPFADALGISLRTLGDIETGRRERYDPATVAALENTLGWTTGSVQRIIAGGEPTLDAHAQGDASVPDGMPAVATFQDQPAEHDEALRRVMLSDLPDEQKRRIARILIDQRRDAERQRVANADQLIRFARGED